MLDRTSGLRGYLHFDEGQPVFTYDQNDPDELSFINTATRYFQVYEGHSGTLLWESEELQATGVTYSPADVTHYAQTGPSFIDLHTDQGKLRLRNEVFSADGNT